MSTSESTYHHGSLRDALIAAGMAALEGASGLDLSLRELARTVGVSPAAVYRHFPNKDALLAALAREGLEMLGAAQRKGYEAVGGGAAGFVETGRAYVRFAQAEPGLFRTGFSASDRPPAAEDDPAMAGSSGLNPFQLLGSVLDEIVATGTLAAARRPGAEYVAWSSVHGLSMLLIDGPLRSMPPADRAKVVEALLHTIERGLA